MKYIFPSIDAGVDVTIAISKEKTVKKKVKGRDTFFYEKIRYLIRRKINVANFFQVNPKNKFLTARMRLI